MRHTQKWRKDMSGSHWRGRQRGSAENWAEVNFSCHTLWSLSCTHQCMVLLSSESGCTYELHVTAFLTVTLWSGESPLLVRETHRGHRKKSPLSQDGSDLNKFTVSHRKLNWVRSGSWAKMSPPQEAILSPWPFTRAHLLNHLLDFLLLAMHHVI